MITENTNLLIYASTIINFISYLPEYYEILQNKNKNLYNIPECTLILISGILGLLYSINIGNNPLFINFVSIVVLDLFHGFLIVYYSYYNGFSNVPHDKFINEESISSKTMKNDDENDNDDQQSKDLEKNEKQSHSYSGNNNNSVKSIRICLINSK